MNTDGSGANLLIGDSHRFPRVSADGRYVFFLVTDPSTGLVHIGKAELNGSMVRQLTSGKGEEVWPDPSPDGHWLVYESTESDFLSIRKMSADGGDSTKLTDHYAWNPSVSPNGKFIAFNFYDEEKDTTQRVAIVGIEGGAPIKVLDIHPSGYFGPIRWTSDSKALLYIQEMTGISNIWSQPLSGALPRQVTNFATNRIFWFDVSPDGKQLALARGDINTDVVLMRDKR
jgi:Tol biopolymer transport system component